MAAEGECMATTSAVEKGDLVTVTCLVDGLLVSGMFSNKAPKNAKITVDFTERSFDMKAIVVARNKEIIFRKQVHKLPGEIKKDQCTWKVDKGKVIITLVKASDNSWAVQLQQRGLEQMSDEEDE